MDLIITPLNTIGCRIVSDNPMQSNHAPLISENAKIRRDSFKAKSPWRHIAQRIRQALPRQDWHARRQ